MNRKKELLLGDNPFFGVDNLSQERARERLTRLKGIDKIIDVMQFVSDLGIKGFVVSTHPQLKDLIMHMKDSNLLEKYHLYPILPYAQGYVSKAAEKGIINGMNDILSSGSTQDKLKIIFKGSIGFLMKDFTKLLQTFIDVELLPLQDTKKNVIFLHDGVTDLAISLKMKNVITTFTDYIADKYGIKAGLVTKNFPRVMKTLEEWDVKLPTLMTSFNPIGYQMNPSREDCEKYLSRTEVIAMNVLAAGYVKPHQSFEYLSKLDVDAAVIGMSSKDHAYETIMAFNKLNNIS